MGGGYQQKNTLKHLWLVHGVVQPVLRMLVDTWTHSVRLPMGRETGPDTTSSSPPLKHTLFTLINWSNSSRLSYHNVLWISYFLLNSPVSAIGEERSVSRVTSLDKCCRYNVKKLIYLAAKGRHQKHPRVQQTILGKIFQYK